MSVGVKDFEVFGRYRDAGGHAFSKGVVTDEDRGSYQRVFDHLRDAVSGAVSSAPDPDLYDTWNCRFSMNGGIQGQRPIDLWASIINADSDAFSRFPQIYAIASETGVEVGFSVTIHESDYFDQALKRKNRAIVPMVNAKLPSPGDALAVALASVLDGGDWKFGEKNRQGPESSFGNFQALLGHLKSSQSTNRGGGTVYRILSFADVAEAEGRLQDELEAALATFAPLMQRLRPTSGEASLASSLQQIADYAEKIAPYDPADDDDGKKRKLRDVAIRQGQGKFRDELIEAYEGRCAISDCKVLYILQAAHISPCLDKKSNHVSNGLLLRADIHTLFDLGLIRIDPVSCTVVVSKELEGTDYVQFSGKTLISPAKPAHHPSKAALVKKFAMKG